MYAHELFHIYQSSVAPRSRAEATVLLPLWHEGLATYVSGRLNLGVSDEQILMDASLARLSQKDLAWLATEYLKIAERSAGESALHEEWFAVGKLRLRENLPSRCGYRLGLDVIRRLAQEYSLFEMARWDHSQIAERVSQALKFISRTEG